MRNSPQDIHKKSLGRAGERRAVKYLRGLGYKILKVNDRTPFGEADIVARDGETVVLCEVKTRESETFGTPAEAVTAQKRRRYVNMARAMFARKGREFCVRFDVLEVTEEGINHIISAFEA